jgi:hypothetical protein
MSKRIKQGGPRSRGGFRSRFWYWVNLVVSSIFLTVAVLLALVAVAEVLVYLIDAGSRSGTYLDWWRGPMIIFFSSLPFLAIHLVLRFNLISRLNNRIRSKAPPKKIETIDLD